MLTSGEDLEITDILHDDTLVFHFMEFMDGRGDRDVLEFWMAVNNFRFVQQSFQTAFHNLLFTRFVHVMMLDLTVTKVIKLPKCRPQISKDIISYIISINPANGSIGCQEAT